MRIPEQLLYTPQHEWLKAEGDVGTVGISDFAQNALGDVTFIELPQRGKRIVKGQELGAVESCKAAAGVCAPASGTVVEVNDALGDDPSIINSDPYGDGWICRIRLSDPAELSELMDAGRYRQFCGGPP